MSKITFTTHIFAVNHIVGHKKRRYGIMTSEADYANKTNEKPDHSIAVDGQPASTLSMPCYTMSDLEGKLGIDFGEKVQSNVRVRKWFREKEKELAEKYASSTCEFRESIVVSMWLADQGIKEFLILTPTVNFYAQPMVVRYVKKRRRKLSFSIEQEEYALVLSELGNSDKCYGCGGSYHVDRHLSADMSCHVFLCPYCALEWGRKGKLRVIR